MITLKILFALLLSIVFYAYIGYGILLYFIIKIRRIIGLGKQIPVDPGYEPDV